MATPRRGGRGRGDCGSGGPPHSARRDYEHNETPKPRHRTSASHRTNAGTINGTPSSAATSDSFRTPRSFRGNHAHRGGYSASPRSYDRGRGEEWRSEALEPFKVEFKTTATKLLFIAKMSKRNVTSNNVSVVTEWLQHALPTFLTNTITSTDGDSDGRSGSVMSVSLQIELQDNDIDSRALTAIIDAIIAHIYPLSSPLPIHLTAVKLWCNRIDDSACDRLSSLIAISQQRRLPIEELHLSHNQITETGASALLTAIRNMSGGGSEFPVWLRLEWNLINVKSPALVSSIEEFQFAMMSTKKPKSVTAKPTNQRRKERRALVHNVPINETQAQSLSDDRLDAEAQLDVYDDDTVEQTDSRSNSCQLDSEIDSLSHNMRKLEFDSTSTSTSTNYDNSASSKLRVCYAADRQQCSVRMCRFGRYAASVHLYCWPLQHTRFDDSDLLNVISTDRKDARSKKKVSQPSPVTLTPAIPPATAVVEAKPTGVLEAPASPLSVSIPVIPSTASPFFPSSRPLILFLDTNVVFAMISATKQLQIFHWDNLYRLAALEPPLFGASFPSVNDRIYIVLSAAVLHEIDTRKEFNKKLNNTPTLNKSQYESHLAMKRLSQQIKQQFELTLADPSQSFLAKCKRQGWLQTLSVHDTVNSVLFDSSALDSKNSSNDRKIMNMARHWQSSIGERGVVVLLSEDGNVRNECALSDNDIECASIKTLERCLTLIQSHHPGQSLPLTAGLVREALRIGSSSSNSVNVSGNADSVSETKPVRRLEMNVYEALDACSRTIQQFQQWKHSVDDSDSDNGTGSDDIANTSLIGDNEVDHLLSLCESLIAHAPKLVADIRQSAQQ